MRDHAPYALFRDDRAGTSLVFAEPDNAMARARLAESYEQQGYQSESAIWRNQFLAAARQRCFGPPAKHGQVVGIKGAGVVLDHRGDSLENSP